MKKSLKKELEKKKYAVFKEGGVQVCRWTKNSLNDKGVCWKETFYGIESHRCCQFSPCVMFCDNACVHCWRPIEYSSYSNVEEEVSSKEYLDKIIELRKQLLIGYKGNIKDIKKFEQSINPTLFTFSLSGEPTLYKGLAGLIKEIRNRKAVSFLVSNGLHSDVLLDLEKENALPTQLTISCNASNKKLFDKWHNSKKKNAWKEFNKTLEVLRKLKEKTRTVLRLTLVKKSDKGNLKELSNMKDKHVKEYVDLIKKSMPMFIHVKGYMSVGFARQRMDYDKQPWHYDIKRFAEKLVKEMKRHNELKGYKILAEEKRSNIVMIGFDKKLMKIKDV